MKKSFLLYLDQQELFNKLPDEAAGKLIKHIFSYVNLENPIADDLLIDVAFSSIKQALKRDLEKWDAQLKQRSEAGKISAKKRANEKQRKATTVESRSTKSTDSVNVNVNDSVSVSDKDKTLDQSSIDREFDHVWNLYEKKGNKKTSKARFSKLSASKKESLLNHVPNYVFSTPDKQFRKNFETYINQECWNDEVITHEKNKSGPAPAGYKQSAVERVRATNEANRAARAANRESMGNANGCVRERSGEPVRDDNAGGVGFTVDGDYIRTDQERT